MQRKAVRATVDGVDRDVPISAFSDAQPVMAWDSSTQTFRGQPAEGRSLLGAYLGGSYSADYTDMTTLINRPLDFITAYSDGGVASNDYIFYPPYWPPTQKMTISCHLSSTAGWDLAAAAAGSFDAIYEQCALNLVPLQDRIIAVRIGWEMNGDWQPWSAGGPGTNQTAATYIGAYRRYAGFVRKHCPGLLIDWCPNWDRPSDTFYPGDDVVDIIGVDLYQRNDFFADDWEFVLEAPSSLYWQEAFAAAHGKLQSLPEWGSNYNTPTFIKNVAAWIKRPRVNRFYYHAYWNSTDDPSTKLSDYPLAQAEYVAAFGV